MLATEKQISLLIGKGYPYSFVSGMTKEYAHEFIGDLKANNWKAIPYIDSTGKEVLPEPVKATPKRGRKSAGKGSSEYRVRKAAALATSDGSCLRCASPRGRAVPLPGKKKFAILCGRCRDAVVSEALSRYEVGVPDGDLAPV